MRKYPHCKDRLPVSANYVGRVVGVRLVLPFTHKAFNTNGRASSRRRLLHFGSAQRLLGTTSKHREVMKNRSPIGRRSAIIVGSSPPRQAQPSAYFPERPSAMENMANLNRFAVELSDLNHAKWLRAVASALMRLAPPLVSPVAAHAQGRIAAYCILVVQSSP